MKKNYTIGKIYNKANAMQILKAANLNSSIQPIIPKFSAKNSTINNFESMDEGASRYLVNKDS